MRPQEPSTFPGPNTGSTLYTYVNGAGTTGVVLMLLATGFSKAAQNIGMALALLALLAALALPGHPFRALIRREALAWLTLAWVLYLTVLAVTFAHLIPETAADQYDGAWKLSRLFLVLLVGLWVTRLARNPILPYLILFAGFVLGALYFHHQQDWPLFGLTSRRLDFWENPQFYGLLSGTVLLGSIFLARDILGHWRRPMFAPRLLFWLALTGLSLNAFLISEARGTMMGLLTALVVAGALLLARYRRGHAFTRTHALVGVIGVSVVAGTLWLGYERAEKRFSQDFEAIERALNGSEEIRPTNMGIRLVQWEHAVALWKERPVLGWGPGSGEHLHEQAALPQRYRSAGNHFHNTHLDLALWTGTLGLLLFLATLAAWARSLWQSFLLGGSAGRVVLFGWSSAVVFLVAALTQTFITSQVSWFFLGAFLGPAWGIALSRRHAEDRTHEH